ncbi:hypothetical protein N657DRAFT_638969 [Parathielavia appendiculata]|uniref:Clr5 domain-containing protein n=1 Tax=Parathielavia appendiculata TaxID=2587402 RepID=A0AAN6UBF9_9PEZI|nr:hypothetical protein N657DRAFT_638969 [Parathielavia appendiculata]
MTKQWDKYREIIIAEYKDQNKPLHEVQRSMVQKYGFRASYVSFPSWSPSPAHTISLISAEAAC